MPKITETQSDKDWVQTKFTQEEVAYTDYAVRLNPVKSVCQTCRWFQQKSYAPDGTFLGSDCHIVECMPLDIVGTGYCNQWTPRKMMEPEPMEVIVVEADSAESEYLDIGERAIGIAASTPMPAVDTQHKRWTRFMRPREPYMPGFKIQDNTWFAVFSNNFEDKDKEFFPEKAIDDYVFRVDTGIVPLPTLVVWHEVKSTEIGKADWVARIGSFLVASGKFHTDTRSQRAKAFYKKNLLTTKHSHGFFYEVAQFKDRAYWQFNTFEISLLPRGVEANPFTTFGA